jgi:hypothetical protein
MGIVASALEQLMRTHGEEHHHACILQCKTVLGPQHDTATRCHHQAFSSRKFPQQSGFPVPKTLFSLTVKYPGNPSTAARFNLGVEINKGSVEYLREMTPYRSLASPHGADKKYVVHGIH